MYNLLGEVNELADQNRYSDVLDLLPRLRAADASVYDRVTFDALEVTAHLHTGRYDDAFRGLDELLHREPIANHLALPLRDGLIKIAQAVVKVGHHNQSPRAVLWNYANRLKTRIDELTTLLNENDDPTM